MQWPVLKSSFQKIMKFSTLPVGNLNLDEYEDAILILKHEDEESDDYKRPLYILIGDSRGKYRVVAENNSSVLGVSDGGI